MNPLTWSIVLGSIGIVGILLAGSKNKFGWAIGFGAQFLWITYAITTEQYGFIPMSLCYGSVYARNFYRWRKDELRECTTQSD